MSAAILGAYSVTLHKAPRLSSVVLIIKASSIFSPSTKPSSKYRKVSLGNNWMEYHGSKNWNGLLDPLDETLRSELLRYGKFVQATYDCFDFDMTSESYANSRYQKNNILSLTGNPSTGYEVIRNLHASSGIQLPKWAETNVPSCISNKTSWIGYVAVCQDDDEIARLGRRDAVIAFRGTATCLEWLENLRATLTHLPENVNQKVNPNVNEDASRKVNGVMVEKGFWSLYSSASISYCSLQEQVRDEIRKLLEVYGGGKIPLSITITGHSLGAALAILAAYDVKTTFNSHCPHVTVISYGGPRVGNARFRRQMEDLGVNVLRIVNTRDIVTKVPGFVVEGSGSAKSPCWISKAGLAYSDVGQELRVSCSSRNMAACHDLDVYLKLVKQLKASCPFTSGRSAQMESEGFQWPPLFLPTTSNNTR